MHAFIPHNERNIFKRSRLFILLPILISTFYIHEGAAMSLFFGEKREVILFSPLEGQITFQGLPLAKAKIKLHISWKDKKGEFFYYHTDENGFFKIPAHKSEYKESPLAQLVIHQDLSVEHDGNSCEVWIFSKKEPAEHTELGGAPTEMICELTNELNTIRGIRSLGGTVCTWQSLKK